MVFDPGLEVGEIVSNDRIHEIFGVDKQQGIRTSKNNNYIVIVSKNIKAKYKDKWLDEYNVYYTGVGLEGDQTLKGRNGTLAKSKDDNKELFFFEVEEKGKYTYRGLCDLIDQPYTKKQKDKNGKKRKVYVFHLRLHHRRKSTFLTKNEKKAYYEDQNDYNFYDKIDETLLNEKATPYSLIPKEKGKLSKKYNVKVYLRDKKVSLNALKLAKFKCEYNILHESFIRKNTDKKYMEAHHLVPMCFSKYFEYSLDVEENIVSLCSECHKKIHYGNARFEMLKILYEQRKDKLKKAGIDITFDELKQMYK